MRIQRTASAGVGETALRAAEHERRAERLRQVERVAGLRAGLRPDPVERDGADDREPVLRLGVADRVAAGEDRARRAHLPVGAVEDRTHDLGRQLLRQRGDREREQRHAAHREDVVQRVRRRDRAEVVRVVDDRREEVDREDERALVVEPVDRCVVGRVEPDEQVLGLGGHEAAQQLLEPRGRVLRRAAACGRQIGELHTESVKSSGGPRPPLLRGEDVRRPIRVAQPESFRVVGMPSALVTGGSSGIGLAIARMLRDEGYDLTLASRTQEKIEAAAAELGAHAIAADMGKEEDCIRVVAEHRERFGGLDVLVNSAGIGIAGTVESLQTKHIDLQLNINLRGLLLVSREAIPLLRETKGWIVNLASIAGTAPTPGLTVYGATKAAVIALTRSQNAELDAAGVRAIAICPGFVDTPMAQWSGLAAEEMIKPEDCAEIVRMCLRLSPRARIPQVVVERVGSSDGVG